jgi:hypothetical protein
MQRNVFDDIRTGYLPAPMPIIEQAQVCTAFTGSDWS